MHDWLAISGVLIAAFVTPGPNNLLVLNAGARGGVLSALPMVAAINVGGLLLLALTAVGAAAAFEAVPPLGRFVAVAGGIYLAALGGRMVLHAIRPDGEAARPAPLPRTWVGVVIFQFANPKAWALTLTVSAAISPAGGRSFTALAALFVFLSAACLLIWAGAGSLARRFLADSRSRRSFDGVMGGLLVVSAGFLAAS